jgi:hypothetical protein
MDRFGSQHGLIICHPIGLLPRLAAVALQTDKIVLPSVSLSVLISRAITLVGTFCRNFDTFMHTPLTHVSNMVSNI